jgi:hypothetical protein
MIELKDQDFMRTSMEEIINSLKLFVARNEINEFKIIIIFSKLEFNNFRKLIETHLLPNDCNIIDINCENEIIGTLDDSQRLFQFFKSGLDLNLLGGISALFMSRGMPGLEVNVYKDSQLFAIKINANLKCVLIFHIWRSFFGHFSQLKTDNEYFECLENLVNNSKGLAFGGVTIDKIAFIDNSCDKLKTSENLKCFLDNICCVTFSGHNVSAFSLVIDLNDSKTEQNLIALNYELEKLSKFKTETICFVFSEKLKESLLILKNILERMRFIGCSGVVHGSNNFINIDSFENNNLFFNKGKCVLVIISINKT